MNSDHLVVLLQSPKTGRDLTRPMQFSQFLLSCAGLQWTVNLSVNLAFSTKIPIYLYDITFLNSTPGRTAGYKTCTK